MIIPLAIVRVVSKSPQALKFLRHSKVFLAAIGALCCLVQPARATVPADLPALIQGANIYVSPWVNSGGQSYNNVGGADQFIVTGTGDGVWMGSNTHADSEHFAYLPWTAGGDVEIVARLVSFDNPLEGQAGLMIRQSNDPGEDNMAATWFWSKLNGGDNNVAFKSSGPPVAGNIDRYTANGYSSKVPLAPPYWLKLVRIGNNYGASWSLDGKDWNPIYGSSGGAFLGTGSFNVGFFVANYLNGQSTLSTAVFDNVYIGAPRLPYKTTWVGNTSGGMADGYASNKIFALWVKPDGTCYANADWDELGESLKAYKDGKAAFAIHPEVSPPINNSGLGEGTITGNANNLFMATANHGYAVYRTDFNGGSYLALPLSSPTPGPSPTPTPPPGGWLGAVGGMAASDTTLFISDTTNNVVRIVDLTTSPPTQVALAATGPGLLGEIKHVGPIAYDGTNFWVVDCGSPFPLTNYVATQAGYSPRIKCFNSAGVYQGRTITDANLTNPTALAKHPTLDRLAVCENGLNQNIRYFSGLLGTPAAAGSFGQGSATPGVPGGIWRGANPGQIYDGSWARFYGPTGVGYDCDGNIYVASNGTNAGAVGGTDLRKFDSSGNLIWKQFGLEFCQVGDFDPASDGQEIYTTEERFTMNYSNTAPGSEWSYTAFTRNPFVANDTRNAFGTGANGAQIRRVGGNLFMYTNYQGAAPPLYCYRFNFQGTPAQGTEARPYASLSWTATPSGPLHDFWFDTNGDGLVTAGETTSIPAPYGIFNSYDVDSQGDIWLAMPNARSAIGRIACPGTQTIGPVGGPAVATVPSYSVANYTNFLCPDPIRYLKSIKYDRTHDVMYCMGRNIDNKWMLARYDNWLSTSATTPDDHTPRWVASLPDLGTDISIIAPLGDPYWGYMGLGLAGDKVFVGDIWGPIRVYDANMGNPVITLSPGPEVSATMGWEDMIMGLSATKRSNGEYLVMVEDAGNYARNLLYRWTPTADTTVPGNATNLTATSQGHAIALTWTGPSGTVTSYNIYRGTVSGSLSLYQSNVNTASFVDTNVSGTTTYYYTVAAVSGVGTGAQSNQASAAAASAQAEFVKYDLTTKGTWNPTGTRVFGSEGYNVAGQTASLPAYVSSLTSTNTGLTYYVSDPTTDVRALQVPSGATRTSAFYYLSSGTYELWDLNFDDATSWHQVSIYMLDWSGHPLYVSVEVLDATTDAVLDTRMAGDFNGGKWLAWNMRGHVKIRLNQSYGNPVVSGIFFDPVKAPVPTRAWWKLDETSGSIAGDSSGAGNNATNGNATWSTSGKFNGCLSFGGHNYDSNFGLPEAANLQTTTMSLWFKTSTSGPLVCSRMDPPGPTPTQFAPYLYVGTDNKLHGAFYTGVIQTMTSAASVNDNQWHLAALTSDGLTQKLYLDGEVTGTLVAPTTLLWYTLCGQGYVTGWPNITGTYACFTGLIDDVRVYNRVLSNAEIWKLKN